MSSLQREINDLRRTVAEQSMERATDSKRILELRRTLLAAEQQLADQQTERDNLQEQLDVQATRHHEHLLERDRDHEREYQFLQATASDFEHRVTRLASQLEALKTHCARQTATHQAQLAQTRRESATDLNDVSAELREAQTRCAQLESQVQALREDLSASQRSRQQQAEEMAKIAQRYQIAEQLVRETASVRRAA